MPHTNRSTSAILFPAMTRTQQHLSPIHQLSSPSLQLPYVGPIPTSPLFTPFRPHPSPRPRPPPPPPRPPSLRPHRLLAPFIPTTYVSTSAPPPPTHPRHAQQSLVTLHPSLAFSSRPLPPLADYLATYYMRTRPLPAPPHPTLVMYVHNSPTPSSPHH